MSELETDDIQGIILSGYKHLAYSRYLFFEIEHLTQAKASLNLIAAEITSANWSAGVPVSALNIAFTGLGLKKLGLSSNILKTFSAELIEGMAEPRRSMMLNDQGENAPSQWQLQYRMGELDCFCHAASKAACVCQDRSECHLLIILQTRTEIERQEQSERFINLLKGVKKLECEDGYLPADYKEHFGFHDSISQPDVEGSPALAKKLINASVLQQDVIKAGEFILGYLNQDDRLPQMPHLTEAETLDLGRNGSYLVFRKLKQNVAQFRRCLAELSPDPIKQKQIAAKMIGRWQSGAPLSLNPEVDPGEDLRNTDADQAYQPENRFSYRSTDPDGFRCPLGAHLRRVNPRDSLGRNSQTSIATVNRHRILRRGALYGDRLPEGQEDNGDRGIFFFCINANIKQQFEFIQTEWIHNSRFNNLNNETDPILGHDSNSIRVSSYNVLQGSQHHARRFTIQKHPVREKLYNLSDFVTLRGGGYFFLPSISTLRFLSQ